MWTLAFGHHEDRMPTHGYAETREAAMTAFAEARPQKAGASSPLVYPSDCPTDRAGSGSLRLYAPFPFTPSLLFPCFPIVRGCAAT
jgi:hypothetical protein